jgi:hypothetical protein
MGHCYVHTGKSRLLAGEASTVQYLLVTAATEDMIRTSSGARWKGILARSWQCLVARVWWRFEAVLGRFHCHAWPTRACRAVREMSCVKECVLVCALAIRSVSCARFHSAHCSLAHAKRRPAPRDHDTSHKPPPLALCQVSKSLSSVCMSAAELPCLVPALTLLFA